MHKKSIEILYKMIILYIKMIEKFVKINDKIHNFLNKMLTSTGGGGIF